MPYLLVHTFVKCMPLNDTVILVASSIIKSDCGAQVSFRKLSNAALCSHQFSESVEVHTGLAGVQPLGGHLARTVM